MTDVTAEATGFDALKGLTASVENDAPVYVQKLDAQGRAYSTGKRKNAIARVWVKPGTGKFTINGKDQLQIGAADQALANLQARSADFAVDKDLGRHAADFRSRQKTKKKGAPVSRSAPFRNRFRETA